MKCLLKTEAMNISDHKRAGCLMTEEEIKISVVNNPLVDIEGGLRGYNFKNKRE